jgi:hypothetical protein
MATIAYTVVTVDKNTVRFTWEGFTVIDTDPGAPVVEEFDVGVPIHTMFMDYVDRSVQVKGTFGTNGTILIEGSNHGDLYATLNDPQGNALSVTTAKIEQVMEVPLLIRPRLSNGQIGTTDIDVIIIARRARTARGT